MTKPPDIPNRPAPKVAAALVLAALLLIAHGSLTSGEETLRSASRRWTPSRPPPVATTRAPAPLPPQVSVEPAGNPAGVPAVEPGEPVVATEPPAVRAKPVPIVASESPPPLPPLERVLTRIVFVPGDPDSSFAVVGGRAVRAGDPLDAVRAVREILVDRVLLSPDSELRLALTEEEELR